MDVQLLVPNQECLALLDHWLCGFLGDIESGNVFLCITLIYFGCFISCKTFNVRRYYNKCIRRLERRSVYGRHLDGLWFDVVEELVIL